jgi:hypothetical protein
MAVDPDRLARLEDERRFLLRSLADLEREHAAGDVDEVDYRALKDGYTVRAAATLREIEEGRSSLPGKPAVDWKRRALGGLVVVALIAVVSWALAASSAERSTGQTMTGLDPRDEEQVLLAQARDMQLQSPAAAAELYAQVLALEPEHVEALTYRGWTLALDAVSGAGETTGESGDGGDGGDGVVVAKLQDAIDSLLRANRLDPTYADPQCFLGIINYRFLGDAAGAEPWVQGCLDAGPPADVRGLVEGLAASIDAELTGSVPAGSIPTSAAP